MKTFAELTKTKAPIYKILDYMGKKGFNFDCYEGIAEQGYENKPLICADWNPPKMERIYNWIEKYYEGRFDLGWNDEWMSCNECGRAIRSIHNHYGWEPSYLSSDYDEVLCIECVKNMDEEALKGYINNSNKVLPSWTIEIAEDAGFKCFEDKNYCQIYETGLYSHQTDDPKEVEKFLQKNLPEHDYLFAINSTGQFDIHWSIFIRKQFDLSK